jgi:plastocyanin
MKITGSLIVCGVAAAFTATTLLINPSAPPTAAVPTAAASSSEITASGFAFTSATVAPGATVTIRNLDGDSHTVTAAAGVFDSGIVAPGDTAIIVAPTAQGVYAFVCSIHPSMAAQLTVALR